MKTILFICVAKDNVARLSNNYFVNLFDQQLKMEIHVFPKQFVQY